MKEQPKTKRERVSAASKSKRTDNLKNKQQLNKLGLLNVGVVGTGLMGQSIAACLLSAGHNVVSIAHTVSKVPLIRNRVFNLLKEMKREGLLTSNPRNLMEGYKVAMEYDNLADTSVVVESIVEDLEAKRETFRNIEAVVPSSTIICSNTSAIPISVLQAEARNPERILGTHWAEPAHLTRFMEIICGEKSSLSNAEKIMTLADAWGKEPSLLKKDMRGFITNRLFYALLREAFNLVESGVARIEDVDRSMRNDLGYWITFAGPFRFMDLTGIPAYKAVMTDLFPELDCRKDVPELMKKVVDSGAKGTANAKGFYNYTEAEAKEWEKQFLKFSYEIRALANKYSEKRIFGRAIRQKSIEI